MSLLMHFTHDLGGMRRAIVALPLQLLYFYMFASDGLLVFTVPQNALVHFWLKKSLCVVYLLRCKVRMR